MKQTKDIIKQMEKEFRNTKFARSGGSCFECCEYEEMWDDLIVFIKDYTRTLLESFGEEIIGKDDEEVVYWREKFRDLEAECDNSSRNYLRSEQRLKMKEIISSIGK